MPFEYVAILNGTAGFAILATINTDSFTDILVARKRRLHAFRTGCNTVMCLILVALVLFGNGG